MNATQFKQLAALLTLALVFVAVSYLAHRYQDVLAYVVESGGALGIAGFIALTAVFVIFVIPLDIAFLIPLGANAWGPVPTALMSIVGWTVGASAAFAVARWGGVPLVRRLIGLERIRAIEGRIPRRNLFWAVVLLRMLVSVDILSYALGLFSNISWRSYVLATFIGVTPFGFYFAYAGTLPLWYELGAIALALLLATGATLAYGITREP